MTASTVAARPEPATSAAAGASWPVRALATPIFDLFAAVAVADPDGSALVGAAAMTRGRLLRRALSVAGAIRAACPASGRAAILLPSAELYPVAMLGCFAAGRMHAQLDLRYPRARNLAALDDLAPDLILTEGGHADGWNGAAQLDVAALGEACAAGATPQRDLDAPSLVLYTSGSTGRPKGIVNPQFALLKRVDDQVREVGVGATDVVLCVASPSTIAGTREMLTALLSGAALHVTDPAACGLGGLRRLIREHGATVVYAVPSLIRALLGSPGPRADFASLRVIRLGGERVTWSDIDLVHATCPPTTRVQVGYSSTETVGAQGFVARDAVRSGAGPAAGPLVAGLEHSLLEDDGTPAKPGDCGVLVVRGRAVALGHWAKDGVHLDPAFRCWPDGTRSFRTGDVVRIAEDGGVEVLGREDRQVKVNGRRVELAEIEATILRCAGVAATAVLPLRADARTAIVAFVEAGPDAAVDLPAAIGEVLCDALPSAWHPARTHVVAVLPRLPSGKIDAPKLRLIDEAALARTKAADGAPASPDGTRTLAAVRRAWTGALGVPPPSHLSWQAAGGDSLGLLRMAFEVEEETGGTVLLESLRPGMTAAAMAAAIAAQARPHGADDDRRPLVLLLPGLTGDSPALAALRLDLADRFRFALAAYPSWREMAAGTDTVDAIAEAVTEWALAAVEDGAVRILGYSLGGVVGYEVLRRLAAKGCRVEWIVILDACIERPASSSAALVLRRMAARTVAAARALRAPLGSAVATIAHWASAPSRLPALLALTGHRLYGAAPPALRFRFEFELFEALQRRAVRGWIALDRPRLSARALVVRSQQARPGSASDLGWRRLFGAVDVVPAGGDHITMLRDGHRGTLCGALLDALGPSLQPRDRMPAPAGDPHASGIASVRVQGR